MAPVSGPAWARLRAQVSARWAAADPLLPAPCAPPGCGADLTVTGPGGQPAAVGTCQHWCGQPGSLDLAWGASRRYHLNAVTGGPQVPASLDQLLTRWREHLAADPQSAADDTAAVVTWPSRDIDGPATLLRHGLVPLTVIAARPAGARTPTAGGATPASPAPPAVIRRAGPADCGVVARMSMQVVRFDQHFGDVIERAETAAALQRDAARLLAQPQPWTWLAERGGRAVGLVQAEPPAAAAWIAPMAGPAPAAYLGELFVDPGERGTGIGSALTARLHQETEASGVAVTLLHYALLNPLSGPFWNRQAYRPLWTIWEARPARTLR